MLSLGAWCQMGGALWNYRLKDVNTPFDNFGIKRWQNVTKIIESDFEDFWSVKNMSVGKATRYFSLRKMHDDLIYKVYDSKYDMISTHNFDVEFNRPDDLRTYPEFRRNLEEQIRQFKRQCDLFRRVVFVCKALSYPEELTCVERGDILALFKALKKLRRGKNFHLRLSVPEKFLDQAKQWVMDDRLDDQVRVYPWKVEWANEPCPEWDEMLGDLQIPPDHWQVLHNTIWKGESWNMTQLNNLTDPQSNASPVELGEYIRISPPLADKETATFTKDYPEVKSENSVEKGCLKVDVPLQKGWRDGLLNIRSFSPEKQFDPKDVEMFEIKLMPSQDLLNGEGWCRLDLIVQSEKTPWLELHLGDHTTLASGTWKSVRTLIDKRDFPEGLGKLEALSFVINSEKECRGHFFVAEVGVRLYPTHSRSSMTKTHYDPTIPDFPLLS